MLATDGNYIFTRDIFFQWRELVADKKLNVEKLTEEELQFIKEEIVSNPQWNLTQLYQITNILRRYKPELYEYGIDMDKTIRYPDQKSTWENYADDFEKNAVPRPPWTRRDAISVQATAAAADAVKTPSLPKKPNVKKPVVHKEKDSPKRYQDMMGAAPRIKTKGMITFENQEFIMRFQYDYDIVKVIKDHIPHKGRNFNYQKKQWHIRQGFFREVKKIAQQLNFVIGDQAARMMNDLSANFQQSYESNRVELNIPLKKRLMDFQTVGVDYCSRVKKSWLCDSMGLGKTPMAIGTAMMMDQWPIMVVCPKSLRYNWEEEWKAWADKKVIVADKKNMAVIGELISRKLADVVIFNYEGLNTHFVMEFNRKKVMMKNGRYKYQPVISTNGKEKYFKGIIVDESHEIKNSRTKKFRILHKLTEHMEYKQLLTGTPIVNKVEDAASQLAILDQLASFGGYNRFVKMYSALNRNNLYKQTDKAPLHLQDLNRKLRTLCMIRREKHQVLTDLPDKMRRVIPVQMDKDYQQEYNLAEADLKRYLQKMQMHPEKITSAMQGEILTQFMHLSQIAMRGKIKSFVDFIDNVLQEGEKLVVFVWHREAIDLLREHFPNLLEISGRTDDQTVQSNIHAFQNSKGTQRGKKGNLIVCTYKRGGMGITLTAASQVAFIELGWNPKDQDQAEDRLHRISAKSNVTCHYFLAKNTVDEHKYEIIQQKRAIFKHSVDSTENTKESVLHDLISLYSKRKPEKHEKPTEKPKGKGESTGQQTSLETAEATIAETKQRLPQQQSTLQRGDGGAGPDAHVYRKAGTHSDITARRCRIGRYCP